MPKKKTAPDNTFQQPSRIVNLFVNELFLKTVFQNERFFDTDLSPSHIKLLFSFSEDDRAYPIGELGKNGGIKKSTMTNIVDSLEKDGIVKRVLDPEDRRVVLIRLSARGKKMKLRFTERAAEEMQVFFSKLDTADRDRLLHHLQEAYTIIKKI